MAGDPRLLVTGFGPFPGAPANPTAGLVEDIAGAPPGEFAAGALAAAVLPTDFRRGWSALASLTRRFRPDIVVHFGLSRRATALMVERQARRRVDPGKPDAAGHLVKCGYARRPGADALPTTLAAESVVAALNTAGHAAELSDDAGDYVCNFIFYRSLHSAAGTGRSVGFVHVPPTERHGGGPARLREAAAIVLLTAAEKWARAPSLAKR